jgi:hypothetical protein
VTSIDDVVAIATPASARLAAITAGREMRIRKVGKSSGRV